jgi:hypothetical protein
LLDGQTSRVTQLSNSYRTASSTPSLLNTSTQQSNSNSTEAQLLKNFQTFYGTRRFIPVFTRAPSYLSDINFNIIFLTVSSLLDFPPNSYMHSYSFHTCYMPYPSNYTWRTVYVMKVLRIYFDAKHLRMCGLNTDRRRQKLHCNYILSWLFNDAVNLETI